MTTLAGQSRTSELEERAPQGDRIDSFWPLGIALCCMAGGMVWAFYDFFRVQVYLATSQPSDWGHVFVIPLIAFWFVWLRRDELLQRPLKTSWSGLWIVLLGILLYITAMMGPGQFIHHLTRAFGVFVASFGLVMLLLGWRSLKVVGFPFLYLFAFGVVISDRIMTPVTYELQDISAKGAWLLLTLVGFDTDLSGNTLTLFEGGKSFPLNVAEACSGMRMLVAFLALGTAMAYVGLSRTWQRTLLIALGVPVAIFVNVLRVVTLGLLSRYDGEFAAGDFHTFIGLVWLFPAFIVFIMLMWAVRKLVVEPPISVPPGESAPELRYVGGSSAILSKIIVVTLVFAVSGTAMGFMMAAMNGFLAKKSVPLRASLDTIPSVLGEWEQVGDEREYDAAIIESLGTTQFIDRIYVQDGDPKNGTLMMHISYYSGTIDEVPHIPERCWHAAGLTQMGDSRRLELGVDKSEWSETSIINQGAGESYQKTTVTHPVTGVVQDVLLPVGKLELMTSVFTSNQDAQLRRVGGYFFIANGRSCASSFEVRGLAFDWEQEYAYYCKVQFSMVFKVSEDDEDFLDSYQSMSTDVVKELLPDLMRCLPDWSEIEQRLPGNDARVDNGNSQPQAS